MTKTYIEDFDEWCEVYYYVSNIIENTPLDITMGERWQLSQKLTDDFQLLYAGVVWSSDNFDIIDKFVKNELKNIH